MADPERGTKKVSQSAIKEIQGLGMSKAIKQYTSGGGSPEFRTAVERYYSPKRLKDASTTAKPASTPAATSEPKSVPMPASAPAAATRSLKPKGMAQSLGAPMKDKSDKPKTNFYKNLATQSKTKSNLSNLMSSSDGKKKSTKLPKGQSIFD